MGGQYTVDKNEALDVALGQIRFPELVTVFHEQARGLINGGADLII